MSVGSTTTEPFALTAKTVFGMERVLADELRQLGAERIEVGRRLVDFSGDRRLLYRANLWLRTAIRVLRPIHAFAAENEKALYDGVRQVDWSAHLDPAGSLAIDPIVHSSFCTHSLYAAQLAKDAIVDQFRDARGSRPSVNLKSPDLRINLHLNDNRATLYLDSSGDSLHKRGYRAAAGEAPLNEVLAAGILRVAEWDRNSPLADFMCGSGTLPIEAALAARRIAPGLIRREFGYMRWPDFDAALHEELLAEARQAVAPALAFPIVGGDLDPQAIEWARDNARRAGVAEDIRFEVAHYKAARPPAAAGTLVVNPPYNERMKVSQLAAVYRRIGEALEQNWAGWTAFLLTGNAEAAREIGPRPTRRIRLLNGPIRCELLRYKLRPPPALASGAPEISPSASTGEGWGEGDAEQVGAFPLTPSPSPAAGRGETADEFRNRLVRMARHWKRWARRQGISCFRLYDRDVAAVPLVIDWYEGYLAIAEYVRPHDRTELEHEAWLARMLETAADALAVSPDRICLKRRRRQRGLAQYERQADDERRLLVEEGGHRFEINLSDYLDVGLFLDHRQTRAMVEREVAGKRFLNLFGYTGAFTVYAAAGGAAETTTVDLSNTYLDWTRRNLRHNGFTQPQHRFVRDDAVGFLRHQPQRRGGLFDLAIVDPPTFSNSKRTPDIWDIQRDHVELLNLVLDRLAPGGKIYFSTNFRRFKFQADELREATIREISRQTIPPDFRNKRIHRCWTLLHREDAKHAKKETDEEENSPRRHEEH